jgi:TatD DNase family protein
VFPLADTHCHLDFRAFDSDRQVVISRASADGIRKILNPGINVDSSRAAVGIAAAYPVVFAAIGVHPNDGNSWGLTTLSIMRELAKNPKVRAIGEIGLDYYRDYSPRELQKEIFQAQLDLAAELSLPVVIHNRNADVDMLPILDDWQSELVSSRNPLAKRPGVLHSFSGDLQSARRAVSWNFFLGITGPVTFKKADALREIVREIPIESLLIETDAPFLTPHPHRGKRNEPSHVRFIAGKIAEVKAISVDEVGQVTSENAERLFEW